MCVDVCMCLCLFVCVCTRALLLCSDVFLISVDERAKHDQQFHSLAPNAGGYITGNYFVFKSQRVLQLYFLAVQINYLNRLKGPFSFNIFCSGDQAKNFFLQSGLPPPILAQIW